MTYVDTSQRDEYTATADQTVFAYTFRILADSELRVYNEGVLQTLTTDYTVSGAGDAGGGNVTFVTGVTLNNSVIILRSMGEDQSTDYTASGPFPAATHETALDKLAMKVQDLQEQINRALKFGVTSLLSDFDVPEGTSASDRATKVFAYDSAGTGLDLINATNVDSTSLIAVKGDQIQGGATGDAQVLNIGANGDIQYVSSGLLAYDKPWSIAWKKGADIASANALTVGDDGNYFDVTGTTAITSITTVGVGTMIRLHFDGVLTLTHHATDLILPGGANIITVAGDEATFIEYASGDWRMVSFVGTNTFPLDEDDMSSDSAVRPPSQQSTKAYVDNNTIQLGTEVATTSGTAADFTSIPSGVKRISVMLIGVSTDGTNDLIIQIGDAGGIEATGYLSKAQVGAGNTASTAGFIITHSTAAAGIYHGIVNLTLENSTGFTWAASANISRSDAGDVIYSAGSKSLSAELDRVRVTSTGTPDTFDAGVVNIQYE